MIDISELSQAIKKLANDIDYDFFPGQGGPRKDAKGNIYEYVLNGAFQLQKGGNRPLLQISIVVKQNNFRVRLDTKERKKAKDLPQLLNIINEWLVNIKSMSE